MQTVSEQDKDKSFSQPFAALGAFTITNKILKPLKRNFLKGLALAEESGNKWVSALAC